MLNSTKARKNIYKEIKGDGEAMTVDEDYLSAMMYGMAPNSGVGIGIDRLTAVLTGVENLRETIFFPLLRKS